MASLWAASRPSTSRARVRLGVAPRLRLGEDVVVAPGVRGHRAQDVVGGAVDDAPHRVDPVRGEVRAPAAPAPGCRRRPRPRTGARRRPRAPRASSAGPCVGQQRLVGGDDGLAGSDGRLDQRPPRASVPPDELDHDVDVRVAPTRRARSSVTPDARRAARRLARAPGRGRRPRTSSGGVIRAPRRPPATRGRAAAPRPAAPRCPARAGRRAGGAVRGRRLGDASTGRSYQGAIVDAAGCALDSAAVTSRPDRDSTVQPAARVRDPSPRARVFSGVQPSGPAPRRQLPGRVPATTSRCRTATTPSTASSTTTRSPRPTTRELIRRNTHEMALGLLALGLDPERAVLFRQSDRPEHVELMWLLRRR